MKNQIDNEAVWFGLERTSYAHTSTPTPAVHHPLVPPRQYMNAGSGSNLYCSTSPTIL